MKDHRLIDERSLAFHRLIARKLRENPALVEKACVTLRRWLATGDLSVQAALLEWQHLTDGPFDDLLESMERDDERGARLRQSSPFCGFLSREERTGILQEFQARDALPA